MVLIRFILNFILFGALFYLIWHFFPDAFTMLVSWVKVLVEFVQQLLTDLFNRLSNSSANKDAIVPVKTAMLSLFFK